MDIDKLNDKYSLTIGQYITNPTGNKGNLFLNLAMVQEGLKTRYNNISNNEKFKINIYKIKNDILLHVFVPSEKYDLTYDVIVQLINYKEDDKPYDSKLIKNTQFKVFSNSPGFAFTYGYVFYKRDLLIQKCIDKMGKDILQRQPYQRNYYQIVNIDKSIYFAINFILDKYHTIGELEENSGSLGFNYWNSISTIDEKIKEYNKARTKFKEEEKAKLDKSKKEKLKNVKVTKSNIPKSSSHRVITGKDHRVTKKKGKSKIK